MLPNQRLKLSARGGRLKGEWVCLVCGRRRPQLSVKRRTPSSPASWSGFPFPLLSGRVRPVAAGALEVPLSLLYALSGDERCSSAQWGIRKSGGAN